MNHNILGMSFFFSYVAMSLSCLLVIGLSYFFIDAKVAGQLIKKTILIVATAIFTVLVIIPAAGFAFVFLLWRLNAL